MLAFLHHVVYQIPVALSFILPRIQINVIFIYHHSNFIGINPRDLQEHQPQRKEQQKMQARQNQWKDSLEHDCHDKEKEEEAEEEESGPYEAWVSTLVENINPPSSSHIKEKIHVPLQGGKHRCNKFLVVKEGTDCTTNTKELIPVTESETRRNSPPALIQLSLHKYVLSNKVGVN